MVRHRVSGPSGAALAGPWMGRMGSFGRGFGPASAGAAGMARRMITLRDITGHADRDLAEVQRRTDDAFERLFAAAQDQRAGRGASVVGAEGVRRPPPAQNPSRGERRQKLWWGRPGAKPCALQLQQRRRRTTSDSTGAALVGWTAAAGRPGAEDAPLVHFAWGTARVAGAPEASGGAEGATGQSGSTHGGLADARVTRRSICARDLGSGWTTAALAESTRVIRVVSCWRSAPDALFP